MRLATVGLMTCLCLVAVGQQTTRPKKVLTPEQIAAQQKSKAGYVELMRLRAIANKAYQAEMNREKDGDCRDAQSTYDINMCLGRAAEATDANYKAYTSALHSLLGPTSDDEPSQVDGPTGHVATAAENLAAFDAAEAAWRSYAKLECDAVDKLNRGGTIVNEAVGECHQRMVRARMHELANAYDGPIRR